MICDKWLHIYGNKLGTGVNCEWVDDVRENVRGEWIRRDSRYVGWISFDCSVCGETLELDRETSNDFKYCPFCGAEMREVNYELETRTID